MSTFESPGSYRLVDAACGKLVIKCKTGTALVHTPRGVMPLLRVELGGKEDEPTMPRIDFADLGGTPVSTPKPAVFESPDEAIAWLEAEWSDVDYLDQADLVEDEDVSP